MDARHSSTIAIDSSLSLSFTSRRIKPHRVDVFFAGRHCGQSEYKRNPTFHGETAMMNLSDEMILAICRKINPLDVLHSFIGVNERLNHCLVSCSIDSVYESDLKYIDWWNLCLLNSVWWDEVSPLLIIQG